MFVAACARECVCIVGLGSQVHIATPHMHPAFSSVQWIDPLPQFP